MKRYAIVEVFEGYKVLEAGLPDGAVLWVPLDPNNSDYAEYLRYTAWVEASNDPEGFWAQGEEI
jgi:hypothetical protein